MDMDRNVERVEIAARALESITDFEACDLTEAVTDLLANLIHFCEAYSIDFDARLEMARMHFDAELNQD